MYVITIDFSNKQSKDKASRNVGGTSRPYVPKRKVRTERRVLIDQLDQRKRFFPSMPPS